jgi:hypothetical protein
MVEALLCPDAYPPPPPTRVEMVATHISWVFLTDQDVWKVKRPVDYGFVDSTSISRARAHWSSTASSSTSASGWGTWPPTPASSRWSSTRGPGPSWRRAFSAASPWSALHARGRLHTRPRRAGTGRGGGGRHRDGQDGAGRGAGSRPRTPRRGIRSDAQVARRDHADPARAHVRARARLRASHLRRAIPARRRGPAIRSRRDPRRDLPQPRSAPPGARVGRAARPPLPLRGDHLRRRHAPSFVPSSPGSR